MRTPEIKRYDRIWACIIALAFLAGCASGWVFGLWWPV
jgi:hypothetical protein